MLLLGIIVGIIALTVLVVLHELGHAIVARRNGVTVEEFGVGFPPRAWGKKLKKSFIGKNVLFSINWLPLGGFVKLKGEYDSADKKGDYGASTFWVKTKILLAGVAVNWLTAALLFTVLALFGLPKVIPNQFTVPSDTKVVNQPVQLASISNEYPADKAGLQSRDKIVRFAGQAVETPEAFIAMTKKYQGKAVEVIYSRGGSEGTAVVQLKKDEKIIFGASLIQLSETRSTWSAPIVGVGVTMQMTWETLKGVGSLLGSLATGVIQQLSPDQKVRESGAKEVGVVRDSVAGPVGIFGILFPAAQESGLTQMVLLIAFISLGLAIMNALPIPALDGGRWFTMATFRVLKKELTREREEKIQTIGFMVLMALVVLVTIADVGKLIK
jgi:regulator of sigma E protease